MIRFPGFQPHDFQSTVKGSHWRHRGALGGQVRLHLRRIFGRRYQSWGLPGTNMLHIARRKAYRFPPSESVPRLFIQATNEALRWGIALPLQHPSWSDFVQHMQALPMLTYVLYLMEGYGLRLSDLADEKGGVIGGCWHFDKGELTWRQGCVIPRSALPGEIGVALEQIKPRPHTNIALYRQCAADEAIQWRAGAVDYVAPVLAALVPLYEWWVEQTPAPQA